MKMSIEHSYVIAWHNPIGWRPWEICLDGMKPREIPKGKKFELCNFGIRKAIKANFHFLQRVMALIFLLRRNLGVRHLIHGVCQVPKELQRSRPPT